jgi:DMSO/TMAO reductase YedYZ molybdopterin-dependent catalytic subunit
MDANESAVAKEPASARERESRVDISGRSADRKLRYESLTSFDRDSRATVLLAVPGRTATVGSIRS